MLNKIVKLSLFFLLATLPVCAQGVNIHDIALSNANGFAKPIAGAVVTVCQGTASLTTPCSPLANIYTNVALTVQTQNPFNADINGNYSFWVNPASYSGQYVVSVSGVGVSGYAYYVSVAGQGTSSFSLPDQANLIGWYQIKPTETNTALVDYSGNGNNAIGFTGTAPTIIAGTGGLVCTGAGNILLPTVFNNAKTVMILLSGGVMSNQISSIFSGNGNNLASFEFYANAPSNSNGYTAITTSGTGGSYTTKAYSLDMPWGTVTLGWTMDTSDRIYYNGVEYAQNYLSRSGSSAGLQTGTNYGICGGSTRGYAPATVNIYQVAAWSDVLTAAQMAAADQAMTGVGVTAGVFKSPFNNVNDTTYSILGTGDSIGAGSGLTTPVFNSGTTTGALVLDDTWRQFNLATTGYTAKQISSSVPAFIGHLRPQAVQNINAIWAGTNDITAGSTAQQTLGYLANNCRQTKYAVTGAKCLLFTMVSRTGQDTGKNNLDALMRQKWWQFSDAMVDLASDPNLGADGASANTLYFQDGIHPTQHASFNDVTPMVQRAINRMYGPASFSEATTYASGAPAASAVTATSEATNTMTFTTTLNPPVGSSVVCTGITPAGYNSPNTGWYVRTTSGANFTAFNGTTGLGAGSVFGVCSVPLQKDKDTWFIINNTGNNTLESCMGWTGQNIYIKNINGGSATIVPFASETIDGASTLTIATKATVILQSVLVSSAAGGCNWKQLQNN